MINFATIANSRGYLFGLTLNGDGTASPLSSQSDPTRPYWLHLDYAGADCLAIMKELQLPDAAIDGLVRTDTRPRAMQIQHGSLLILRGVNLNPGEDPEDMVSLRIWMEGNRLITVRHRRILAAQDTRDDLEAGRGPVSIQDLVFVLIEKLASRIADFIDTLEDRIDAQELAVESSDPVRVRAQVLQMRRQSAGLRRFLAPQREALDSFSRYAKNQLDENYSLYIHEQTDRIMRYVEDLDLIRERALVLQEELMNTIAQEQNSRMYVLSLVAAVFLPISFVTGVFGMNVAGLPGLENPQAFFFVSGFMAAAVVGIVILFRKKRWL